MDEITEIISDGPLRIARSEGRSDLLVVSFSGVGRQQWPEPPIEFYRAAKGAADNPALFVRDLSRSWLNAPGMAERIAHTIEAEAARSGATRIAAVGNSMGATMALILSRMVRFDTVMAFTPQVSVHPDIVPEETQWMGYRDAIRQYRFDRIDSLPTRRSKIYMLHGDRPSELIHALRFPKARGLSHLILPGMGHKLTFALKERGVLHDLVSHALAGRSIRYRKLLERQGALFRTRFEAAQADRIAALAMARPRAA